MSPPIKQLNFPGDGFSLGSPLLSNKELSNNKKPKLQEEKTLKKKSQFDEAVENLYKPKKYNSFFQKQDHAEIQERLEKMNINSINHSFDVENLINIFYDQCVKYVKFVFILRAFMHTSKSIDLILLQKYIKKCEEQLMMVESLYENIDKFIIRFQVEIDENKITPVNRNYTYVKNMEYCFQNIKSRFLTLYFQHSNQH